MPLKATEARVLSRLRNHSFPPTIHFSFSIPRSRLILPRSYCAPGSDRGSINITQRNPSHQFWPGVHTEMYISKQLQEFKFSPDLKEIRESNTVVSLNACDWPTCWQNNELGHQLPCAQFQAWLKVSLVMLCMFNLSMHLATYLINHWVASNL